MHHDQPSAERRPTRVSRAVREFLATESSGAIVLFVGAVVALVWANSPWSAGYEQLWSTRFDVSLGAFHLDMDLHAVVNDALMALFFFVVGLEIKRELVEGELRDPRTAALPAIAAAGGMVVPAVLFVVTTAGTEVSHGWGIPMATDIAFALGVLGFFGRGLPSGPRVFLLTLAIVDDIGAIAVIAVVYSSSIDLVPLLGATAALVAVVVAHRMRLTTAWVHLPLALTVWWCTHESGVHATIAGVALGLLTPARPLPGEAVSPAERLTRSLHPLTSFVVIPLFALANAGVAVDLGALSGDSSRLAVAVVVGLVVGKLVGIVAFTRLALRFRIGRLPEGMGQVHLVALAGVAGIGFTVSLFVAELAYPDEAGFTDAAKIGVLAASVVAALLGASLLRLAQRRTPSLDGTSAP
jgi:NhaA family Na+:H+ antiporter